MPTDDAPRPPATRRRRTDAQRNEQALLAAAARVFAASGVNAPIREIAADAGVGVGTIYRHFPTRADLVVAVYRYQVDECAELSTRLLAGPASPAAALHQWVWAFVDFLVTKHGLADLLRPDGDNMSALHDYFLDRLVPACTALLDAARSSGEVQADITAYEFLRGVGNLCIGGTGDPRYDPRHLVDLILLGLGTDR